MSHLPPAPPSSPVMFKENFEEVDLSSVSNKIVNVEDYLDEDDVIPNQKFFVFSYILPSNKNELTHVLFKFRGAFRTVEDCDRHIQTLKIRDTQHNIIICESFKWGMLLSDKELSEGKYCEFEYREEKLNKMMKSYLEQRRKTEEEFEARKNFMKAQAKFDGSKEGQELLSKQKENPFVVKQTVVNLSNQVNEMKKNIEDMTKIIEEKNKVLSKYTEEEINNAEKDIKNYYSNMFDEEDVFTQRRKELLKNVEN